MRAGWRNGWGWLPPIDRQGFVEGRREMMGLALAISVWGLVTGVAMVNGGLPTGWATAISLTVFAGSAQLAATPLLVDRIPLPVIYGTVLVVNLRFVIFGAAARGYFQALSRRQRLLAGFLNGDLGSALFLRRFADSGVMGSPEQWGYFYGGAVVNYVAWHVSSLVGIALGGAAPENWGLELAATLALVAVVLPMLVKVPAVVGVVVTAALAVGLHELPMKLGLLIGVVAGVAAAMTAESLTRSDVV